MDILIDEQIKSEADKTSILGVVCDVMETSPTESSDHCFDDGIENGKVLIIRNIKHPPIL